MRRSGCGRPSAARIGRLIHGPVSTAGGQVPSFSPPSTRRSARCSRASSGPQIASRGWRPKRGRIVSVASIVASSAGHSPPAIGGRSCHAVRSRPAHRPAPRRPRPTTACRPARIASAAATLASSSACGDAPVAIGATRSDVAASQPLDQIDDAAGDRLRRRTCVGRHGARSDAEAGCGLQAAQALRSSRRAASSRPARDEAQRAQRMLEQRQQVDRREAASRPRRAARAARWPAACRPAAGRPNRRCRCSSAAARRRRGAPGRGRASPGRRCARRLQRLAQRQRDHQRLLVRRGAVGAGHVVERGGARARCQASVVSAGRISSAISCRRARIARCAGPVGHLVARRGRARAAARAGRIADGWDRASSQLSSSISRSRPGSTTAPCGRPAITASSSRVAGCEPVEPAAITGVAGGRSRQRAAWARIERVRRSSASIWPRSARIFGQCSPTMARNFSVRRQWLAKLPSTSAFEPVERHAVDRELVEQAGQLARELQRLRRRSARSAGRRRP